VQGFSEDDHRLDPVNWRRRSFDLFAIFLLLTAALKLKPWISPEEYLEAERLSPIRHEYVDGYVYAMAGTSVDHGRIAKNLLVALDEKLRGTPCEAFINDLRLKLPDAYYYPDLMVARDPTDNARYHRERPSLVIEVLSPETERIDRGEKAMAYYQIATLHMYVLVEQERPVVTSLRRGETDWKTEVLTGLSETLRIPELKLEIPLERIYERTAVAKQK
jgi:Uma2 family endonuclease